MNVEVEVKVVVIKDDNTKVFIFRKFPFKNLCTTKNYQKYEGISSIFYTVHSARIIMMNDEKTYK